MDGSRSSRGPVSSSCVGFIQSTTHTIHLSSSPSSSYRPRINTTALFIPTHPRISRTPNKRCRSPWAMNLEDPYRPPASMESTETLIKAQSESRTQDLARSAGVISLVAVVAALVQKSWIASNQELALWTVFGLGYGGIIMEELLQFNKSGVALLMAVGMWAILGTGAGGVGSESMNQVLDNLSDSVGDISQIIYFLIGAMTIVEVVDAHDGFKVVTNLIRTNSKQVLLWVVGFISFFLSSILDNLTTTIVMVSLLRKLVDDAEDRKVYGAAIVIAANAGGAWTPIGDVTTTMLWMDGKISTVSTMMGLFLPSVACCAAALGVLTPSLHGTVGDVSGSISEHSNAARSDVSGSSEVVESLSAPAIRSRTDIEARANLVFGVGLSALVSVPIFKTVTGLPPFLGMVAGLGTLWVLTDILHAGEDDREQLRASAALSRIDIPGSLFFLGILLTVAALESAGLLSNLATYLDSQIHNQNLISISIGMLSAVVDNVPLVAATMGMYSSDMYPMDCSLWQTIAYCAGVGGSVLSIGSAAGVALMGLEKVEFLWYVRNASLAALVGFLGGFGVYVVQGQIFGL